MKRSKRKGGTKMLKDKTVLLGVTGSIAAYKIAYLASALKKLHADVHVLMTKNAVNFINPILPVNKFNSKLIIVKSPNPNKNDATIELSIFKKTVQPIPIINPATTDFFKADKYSIPHLVLFLLKW